MAIASWNVRGLNGEEAMRQAILLAKYHKPDLLFLMETKLTEGKVSIICKKLGFDYDLEVSRVGLAGGIMLLWKDKVEVTHLSSSLNHFSCFVNWEYQQRSWHFCGFYEDPKVQNRRHTWDLLIKLGTASSGPWLVIGDFNEILSHEDEGGSVKCDSQIEVFRVALEVCALQPLDYRGNHFMWVRNNIDGCIKERLDWATINEGWVECFPNKALSHLHLSLEKIACLPNGFNRIRSRFRFENIWIKEPDCKEIIASSWISTDQSTLMATICNKCSTNL